MSRETGEQPDDAPAILLTGPAIEAMPPDRRTEVAQSLAMLLNAEAHVISMPRKEPLAPFSFLIPQPWTDERGVLGVLRRTAPLTEGTPRGTLLLKGLNSLFMRPVNMLYKEPGSNPDIARVLAYHCTMSNEGSIDPIGITFDNPDALRVLSGVGEEVAPVLAQFIDAAGRPPHHTIPQE